MQKQGDTTNLQEELTLKLWGGDDTVKGDILRHAGLAVEKAIHRGYPKLSDVDAEDVVAEAIQRFWIWRDRYDPNRASVFTMLYKFANHVASEHRGGRLKCQKQRIREVGVDAEFFQQIEAPEPDSIPADDQGVHASPVQKALADCFHALSNLQQDILHRYADAGLYELDAATVGKELGNKHKNGVPIPASTVRANRSRAWDSIDLCMKRKNFDLKALGYSNE